MNRSTKTITAAAMFCALAYAAAAVGRFPLVLFLKYDPKDIVIAISGFALGPGGGGGGPPAPPPPGGRTNTQKRREGRVL